jgi:hypothetical protein
MVANFIQQNKQLFHARPALAGLSKNKHKTIFLKKKVPLTQFSFLPFYFKKLAFLNTSAPAKPAGAGRWPWPFHFYPVSSGPF